MIIYIPNEMEDTTLAAVAPSAIKMEFIGE